MNYQKEAIKTLSPNFESSEFNAAFLSELLGKVKELGGIADQRKRAMFYTDKTGNPEVTGPVNKDLWHGFLGLLSELAELAEAIELTQIKGITDQVNFKEELGDFEWYLAVIREHFGLTQEDVQFTNIAKLAKRYPERFSHIDAFNRDLVGERVILTQHAPNSTEALYGLGGPISEARRVRLTELQRLRNADYPPEVKQYVDDYIARHPGEGLNEALLSFVTHSIIE